jgi:hypothetical protein
MRLRQLVVSVILLLLPACTNGSSRGASPTAPTIETPTVTPTTQPPPAVLLHMDHFPQVQEYIGLPEAEASRLASSRSQPYRIVWRDGDGRQTDDALPGRVSLFIDSGVVVDARFDG